MPPFAPLDTLAAVVQAPLHHLPAQDQQRWVGQITTDSRQLQPNSLFVALAGDRFDGHDFVPAAIAGGALTAVVQQDWLQHQPHPPAVLPVADTLAAYQRLGQWWRQQQRATIVAITGSVGKTTTKELVAAALGTQGNVLKTQANFNNEIGVPKTLLQLEPHHDFGVIEMGMRGPGEIALLTHTARPDVAVITNVGTAHIGRLGSEQAIADAKCELLAELHPQGIAVLNHDNARLMATARGVWGGRTLSFGLQGGDIQGEWADDQTLVVNGVPLPLPLPGRHNALNWLAAIAVMVALDLDWTTLGGGVRVELPAGRAQRIPLGDDILLLDETYNAGLESMTAALQLLAQTPGPRHIAVLGTMKELGDHSLDLHRRLGAVVEQLGIDQLLILADPAEALALATGAATVPSQSFADHSSLVAALKGMLQPGDRVLLKASRSVGLDQVVTALQTSISY
ncbi:MAG: UDP-N-acetylmuramoyl-tripeptide--D-alanyl-D-alanine ligase [Cyanobacteriota bacterium]|nr:UDP-N-acetylmuramoyl-tripeptide--D-alanyl-D-alanine ligase [Cyanobacteriota bacterium]